MHTERGQANRGETVVRVRTVIIHGKIYGGDSLGACKIKKQYSTQEDMKLARSILSQTDL